MFNSNAGAIRLWLPTQKCSQCGMEVSNQQIATIMERKGGKLTGRQIHLCPKCRFDFFNKSSKLSDGIKEDKFRLAEWNKDKLQNK